MARSYDWARRAGRGDDDESAWGASLRPRRLDRFTVWDWVDWWRTYGGADDVRRAAGVGPPGSGRCVITVSLSRAPDFLGPYVRPTRDAGLGNQQSLPAGESMG